MQNIKINRTYRRSFQSIERARNIDVSTPSTEKVKSLVAKEVKEPSAIQLITNAVGKMLESKKFSGYGPQDCVAVAVNAYKNC